MEEIRWVETPLCRECAPRREYARRPGCMGCEKLRPARPGRGRAEKTRARPRPGAAELARRDARVRRLREQGLSLGAIAGRLSLPRSTVQGILGRGRRR